MRACLLAIAIIAAAASASAQNATLIGSTFGLEGWNQRSAGDQLAKVRVPGRATVRDPGVEFPQVSRLFDTPEGRRLIREGRIGRFVNTWIDIGPNWIEIDFRRAGSGQFTPARQNTYVFVFDKESPIELQNARIDPRTTLPLTQGRLWARGNRLFLNVQGLRYNSRSFVRIVFDVQPALGAAARPEQVQPEPVQPEPVRPSAAPGRAPVPVPAPGGLASIGGG